MRVVVLHVFADHVFEVAAADNQQSVEALAPNASDPALGVRPRLRHLHRCFDHPYAFGAEDSSKSQAKRAQPVATDSKWPNSKDGSNRAIRNRGDPRQPSGTGCKEGVDG